MNLNLHQHAVLEASAGTGKTHSIGELVLRLLKEERAPLDRILIVTFTEKATGELKSRLRLALEKELAMAGEHRDLLRSAIDDFDQAWIFTLHGFCRRVLQEFPLEQGQDAGSQLVDDKDLLEPCLREIQRRTWRAEYGPLLGDVLQISGYDRQQAQHWEAQVRELAEKIRPGALVEQGQRLEPAAIADWPEALPHLKTALTAVLPELTALVQQYAPGPGREFIREMAKIKRWLHDPETPTQPIRTFHDLVCELAKHAEFARGGFLALHSRCRQMMEEAGVLANSATVLEETGVGWRIVTLLEQIYRLASWPAFRHQLAVRTVPQLQLALDEFKRKHGLWSFQDMIARVDDALDPARNPRAGDLAAMLRQRFRYGIVDEFQDTDPVQWRILQRIFLTDTAGHSPRLRGGLAEGREPRLFLVGDPKQAIFGFRGADLPTYLLATRELFDRHGAQDAPLRVNWRSTPEMIEGLNRLFKEGDWFPAEIRYLPVEPAPAEDRPSKLIVDRTGRPAVNVIDWRQDQYLSKLRRRHAEFMVREIARLLEGSSDGPTMVSINRGPPRPLHAGDICVLVLRRSEARPLLTGLRQAGIPYSFYKQPALWKSQEAVHLRFMLEALSQPEHRHGFRKALLTRFFRITPQDLAQCDEVQDNHPARQLFDQWLDLAGRRQWAALFQSMLEDTGLFFADIDDTEADRRRANYRHLTNQLVQQAYRQNLDLLSLTEWFSRHESLGVVDEDLQPKETERPRVQIMTVHASKGLEFPVVFLAGGWTMGKIEDLLIYRETRNEGRGTRQGRGSMGAGRGTSEEGQGADVASELAPRPTPVVPLLQVFDITDPPPNSPARIAAEKDKLDEQRRLLYVALTRAMFKLYVPFTLLDGKFWKQKGPIMQLLAPALNRAKLEQLDPACAAIIDPAAVVRGGRRPVAEAGGPPAPRALRSAWHLQGPLVPVLDADVSRRGMVIRSFTSLHRAGKTGEGSTFATELPRAEDEEMPVPSASNLGAETAEADPLRGAVFGEIVHGVLEKIDYEAVGQAAEPELLLADESATEKVLAGEIDQYLPQLSSRLPVEELRSLCRERVAQLVWHALHTPLPDVGPLWKIPAQDRLVELSFHFPEFEGTPSAYGGGSSIHGEENFLTGFIDVVLRHGGRYFLVDWKTNALPGYGSVDVARAMEEGDYVLQYRLYLQALVRWLRRSLGPTFDWTRDLGGVYYLFLRGLGGAAGDGVFFHKPTAEDLRLDHVLRTRRSGGN